MSLRPRIKLPETIRIGEIIEVKTLISHTMETGQRRDKDGKPIPRKIINAFRATFDGTPVFTAELHPGTSANPYIVFHFKVPGPGELELTWSEDGGAVVSERLKINAEA
jgi:sulfur-oxidizing protein SoxZ